MCQKWEGKMFCGIIFFNQKKINSDENMKNNIGAKDVFKTSHRLNTSLMGAVWNLPSKFGWKWA